MTARAILMAAGGQSSAPLHRYWRINITKSQYNGAPAIGEIAFHFSYGGSNVITGGTASASSSNTIYTPDKAIDNNFTTTWNANTGNPTWWRYDFGPGRAVDVVELTLSTSSATQGLPTAFSLEWSDDGTTWNAKKYWTTSADWRYPETRVFSMLDSNLHHLWRVLVSASQGDPYGTHMAEVEFHNAIGGPNLIAGGTASASSYYSSLYPPANASDGNINNVWATDPEYPNPNWWKYTWPGTGYSIVELAIRNSGAGSGFTNAPTSFSLQWSNDDIAWTTYKAFTTPATWTTGERRVFS